MEMVDLPLTLRKAEHDYDYSVCVCVRVRLIPSWNGGRGIPTKEDDGYDNVALAHQLRKMQQLCRHDN